MKKNPSRHITILQFGTFLGSAWSKSATVQNALSGFKTYGIIPLNMSAIPEYAFWTTQQTPTVDLGQENVLVGQHPKLRQENVEVSQNLKSSTEVDIPDVVDIPMDANINSMPSTSQDMSRPTAQPTQREIDDSKTLTLSKILAMLSPIPNVKKSDSSQGTSASVAKI